MRVCLLTSDGRHTAAGERIATLAGCFEDAAVVVTGTADWAGATHVDELDERFDAAIAFGWRACLHVFRVDAQKHAYVLPGLEDVQLWHGDEQRLLAALTYDLPLTLIAPNKAIAAALKDLAPGRRVARAPRGLTPYADVGFTSEGGQTPPLDLAVFGVGGGAQEAFSRASEAIVAASGAPEAHVLLELAAPGGPLEVAPAAMQRGVVAIVTPVEGHDELIEDGVSGLVVGFDDVPGAARALDTLARDRALLARLREGALARAATLPTPQDEADAILAAIRDAPPTTDRPERLLLNARAAMEPIAQERRALDVALREYEERIARLTSENEELRAELDDARRSLATRIRARMRR